MLLLPMEIANCGTDGIGAVAERSLLSLDLQKAWEGANMLPYLRVDRKSGLKQAESAMAGTLEALE
jgi:hypothetical protein